MPEINVSSHSIPPKEIDSATNSTPLTRPPTSPLEGDALTSSKSPENLYHPQGEASSNSPKLDSPLSSSGLSLSECYKFWLDAVTKFRNQLRASNKLDLEISSQCTLLAASQAMQLSELMDKKNELLKNLSAEMKKQEELFIKMISEMGSLEKNQCQGIDNLNKGNAEEKRKMEELVAAYNAFTASMKEIGAADIGNGQFMLPPHSESLEAFNDAIMKYQQAVSSFNDYWGERSKTIDEYNVATSTYDQAAAEYNYSIQAFIIDNNLEEFIQNKSITQPLLTQASRRDLSIFPTQVPLPLQDSREAAVQIYTPEPFIQALSQKYPKDLNLPQGFTSLAQNFLNSGVFLKIKEQKYETLIYPFDRAIIQYNFYTGFTKTQSQENELSEEALLNNKEWLQSFIKSLFPPPKISYVDLETNSLLKAIEIDEKDIQILLGKEIIRSALLKDELKSLQLLNQQKKDEIIDELSNKLLALSVALLNNFALQALFPSLGIIADHLATLPKNHPAFALLFATSLTNRLLENLHHGYTSEALKSFIQATPPLNELSAEQSVKLEAALNVGQLLVSVKLLEGSLGIENLLIPIISHLSPSLKVSDICQVSMQDNIQDKEKAALLIYNHCISQGYPEDKAAYFADIGSQFADRVALAPSLFSNLSTQTIDIQWLKRSIQSEVAGLPSYSLLDAEAIADKTLSLTFANEPFSSVNSFRESLEAHLSALGVPYSDKIAQHALIIPPSIVLDSNAKQSIASIKGRTFQLLSSLNAKVAGEIGDTVAETIIGSDERIPYSISQVLQQQISLFSKEDQLNWSERIENLFRESLKEVTNFPAFAKKLQDPAYRFLTASSIIYRTQDLSNITHFPI